METGTCMCHAKAHTPNTQGRSQAQPKHINLHMDGRHSACWYNHGHPPISQPGVRSWPRLRLTAQFNMADGVLVLARSSSPVTRLSCLTPPPRNPSRLELPGLRLQTPSLLTHSHGVQSILGVKLANTFPAQTQGFTSLPHPVATGHVKSI